MRSQNSYTFDSKFRITICVHPCNLLPPNWRATNSWIRKGMAINRFWNYLHPIAPANFGFAHFPVVRSGVHSFSGMVLPSREHGFSSPTLYTERLPSNYRTLAFPLTIGSHVNDLDQIAQIEIISTADPWQNSCAMWKANITFPVWKSKISTTM